MNNIPAETIDVIFISNWMSLMALPFITESTNFRGSIYATGPTVQLGRFFICHLLSSAKNIIKSFRLVMEEFLDMLERVDCENPCSDDWRNENNWK